MRRARAFARCEELCHASTCPADAVTSAPRAPARRGAPPETALDLLEGADELVRGPVYTAWRMMSGLRAQPCRLGDADRARRRSPTVAPRDGRDGAALARLRCVPATRWGARRRSLPGSTALRRTTGHPCVGCSTRSPDAAADVPRDRVARARARRRRAARLGARSRLGPMSRRCCGASAQGPRTAPLVETPPSAARRRRAAPYAMLERYPTARPRLRSPTMMSTARSPRRSSLRHTVKTHLKSIYRKLDVPDRREAVRRARDLELLAP